MIAPSEEQIEAALMNAARYTLYPPTPDIASNVVRRLYRRPPIVAFARVAAVLLILFAALFVAVPEIRAAVLSILRFGAVTLVRETPTPDPSIGVIGSVLLLEGETTLEAARDALPFPIMLPTLPEGIGEPDRVYMPTPRSLAMLWVESGQPVMVMTLHHKDEYVFKYYPWHEDDTEVNGQPAVWLTEPHTLEIHGQDEASRRVINQHILVWIVGDVSYRLETDAPLEDAIVIAESVR